MATMLAPLQAKNGTKPSTPADREAARIPPRATQEAQRARRAGPAWDFRSVPLQAPGRERSGGEPLDSATRRFFERRFTKDFGEVRVHTDQAAQAAMASEHAVASTSGEDVAFAAGQYQPNTPAGRWVIAHELSHVIQQRGASLETTAREGMLESEANEAAMQVALGGSAQVRAAHGTPAVQFLRVSWGGFGKALEAYTQRWSVEDRAIRLLQSSPAFMRLASILDQHYVWPHDPAFNQPFGQWQVGPNGTVVEPASIAGKRAMFVTQGEPEFEPFSVPTNPLGGDVISIKSTDTPTFIQGIAHESTHAAAFVGNPPPQQPQTLVQEIEAGLKDEIAARASEAKIMGQINDPGVKEQAKTVGDQDPKAVERDVAPAQNLTYLENFFFGRELSDAKLAEGLTEDEASDIRTKVGKEPKAPPFIFGKNLVNGIYVLSEYAEAWYDRQTAVKEWKDFEKDNTPQGPTTAAEKEKLLQAHAARFFKGKIAYRSLQP